jgi:cbb3-type cytochrome oxidase maturation protein
VNVIYLLIPLALLIVAVIIGAFLWSVRSGQFDDLEGPAWRILHDDDGVTRTGSGNEQPGEKQNQSK